MYRTNCALSRTKKHTQNKSDISDLYIGQIRRLEKNYTFGEPCFLSLNKFKKHGSQNVYFFPNGAIHIGQIMV